MGVMFALRQRNAKQDIGSPAPLLTKIANRFRGPKFFRPSLSNPNRK